MVEPLLRRTRISAPLAVAAMLTLTAAAQTGDTFKIRLSPVSMDTAMKVDIAGSGAATARLVGSKLSIDGKFEGLLSPATTAQLRRGSFTGVRGPAIFDLKISRSNSGTVEGAVDLTADQIDALRKGRIYLQIASEKAPDGNLWGWLLQ